MKKRNKIALINPGTSAIYTTHEPLNLGFIASYLEKNNIEVKIIDQLAGDNVEDEIETYDPDIVGITGTTPVINDAYKIADLCRKKDILTVIGGAHASVLPEEAIQYADIVVQGEGEKAMLDIALGKIQSGIIKGEYIGCLDEIPLPARHLMKMEFYIQTKKRIPYNVHLTFLPKNAVVGHILTSRGCPHGRCIFCHNNWRNAPYRWDSPEKVISEIQYLKSNYGISALYFMDDHFFFDYDRVENICRLLKKNKLDNMSWAMATRVETINKEILKTVKSAGCKLINFGFESGSQRILDILDKGASVEQAQKAVKLCNEAGIIVHGTFIVGNPTETMGDIEETKKFIFDNTIKSPLIGFMTPYPGTRYWQLLEEKGLIHKDINWSSCTQERVIINISNIPTAKLEKIRTMMYLSYFWRNKKELFSMLVGMSSHPKASFIKIINTVASVFHFLKGNPKNYEESAKAKKNKN